MFFCFGFVGPCPVLCCFAVLLCGETQIWLGNLRVVFGCGFVLFVLFFVMICQSFWPTRVLFITAFHAYAIVRTVPSANRPNRRKKKVPWGYEP